MALLDDIQVGAFPPGVGQLPIEKHEIKPAPASLPNLTALKLVVQDTEKAENYIFSKQLTQEWDRADRLYLFQVPTAYWEGTWIPRANLGMPLVYEHIESILPQVIGGLFPDEPPFQSIPLPGTTMDAARANDALLAWQLNEVNFREEIRLGVKSSLQYGMGIWKWGWIRRTEKRIERRRKQARLFQPMGIGGALLDQADSDEIEEYEQEIEINRPTLEAVNLRHILVDPDTRTSDIRKARYVIHRLYLTFEDIEKLREVEEYDIPETNRLKSIFFPPKEEAIGNSLEGSSLDIHSDFKAQERFAPSTVNPLQQPLEVLEYWTDDRVYTVVQRKLVIRNAPNRWGRKPFVSVAYTDVLDSFYGIGVARLVGGEQRLQQGVINSFLDDLSLSLNGMYVRKRGANTPTQQLRTRPGGVIDTDDENGVTLLQRPPIQMETHAVIAASDARSQRRTAANEMVVQGSLPAEKSSITRTATGVAALTGGSGARLQYFVENIANQVFVPILEAFHAMNGKMLRPSQIEAVLSKELAYEYKGDALDLINVRCKFHIRAGGKLQAKRALGQSLPILFQFLLAEPVIQSLATEGKKVNIGEMVKMLFDVTGWPNRQSVVVDMTPEDQQRVVAQNPMVQQMLAQEAKGAQDHQRKLELSEEENIARAGRDAIKALLDMEKTSAAPKSDKPPKE